MSVYTENIYGEMSLSNKSDVKITWNSFCLWCCVHCVDSTNPSWLLEQFSFFLSWCLPSAKIRENVEFLGPIPD